MKQVMHTKTLALLLIFELLSSTADHSINYSNAIHLDVAFFRAHVSSMNDESDSPPLWNPNLIKL